MCEDGSPYRGSSSEYGDKAARDELLRPEDDRPAPAEIDEADNDRDADRSPAARERLPQRDGHDREERGDRDRAYKREYEWGHVVHADLYRAHVEPQISATVTYPAATRSGGMRER